MLGLYTLMKEDTGRLIKLFGILSGKIAACGTGSAHSSHLFMSVQIVFQTRRHIVALRYNAHPGPHIFQYLGHEQWIVRAAEDDRVDLGILAH